METKATPKISFSRPREALDRYFQFSSRGSDLRTEILAGVTTWVGVRPGMHLWLGMDWDVAHSNGATFMPVRRHISFGITQQFRFHKL